MEPLGPARSGGLALALFAGTLACSGCHPWRGGEVYRPPLAKTKRGRIQTSFRVGLPGEGWEAHRDRGTQVAWHHPGHGAMLQAWAQCEEHGDSSLRSFTDHLRIDTSAWEIEAETPFRLIGRDALRTRVHAALDGVPVHMEIVVVKKNGCLFDLTLMAVPRGFEAALPAFERVLAGFEFPLGARDG